LIQPFKKIDAEKLDLTITFVCASDRDLRFSAKPRYDQEDSAFYFDVYAFFFGATEIPSDIFEVEVKVRII
jgi:hypothetical protein